MYKRQVPAQGRRGDRAARAHGSARNQGRRRRLFNSSDPTGLVIGEVLGALGDAYSGVTDAIGEAGDAIGLTDAAESASMYYAAMTIDPCAGWLAKGLGWGGGLLSSLATKEALGNTVITLATGGTGGEVIAVVRVLRGVKAA